MDIGEGLINKLEDYFGRTIAKIVVGIVVLSICVYATKVIYVEVAKPIALWLSGLGIFGRDWTEAVAGSLSAFSMAAAVLGVKATMASMLRPPNIKRDKEDDRDKPDT